MKLFIALMISLLCYLPFHAQSTLHIPKLNGEEPKLDGDLFEDVWNNLEFTELHMINPYDDRAPSERSYFKIAYSDKYLYFASFNYDSTPELIQSTSKKRDELQLNNDWCGILLDSYNDNENALSFCTTPAALRLDYQVINDGEGDFPANIDWNAIWEVETMKTEEGWFAEFRIPLSTLRYQLIDDKVVLWFSAFRFIARKSEWSTYPDIPNKWGFWSWAKVSQFQDAQLEGVKAVNPFYFSPYILGGYQQSFELNDAPDYTKMEIWKREIGMDMKFGLAKNLTLDLTVNTDFAQVEADDQEVNLTRFSLFFPEKRQFFMERSNVFEFNFSEESRLFYSRTIGLNDGYQVPLLGGGRITGRVGDWDLGIMSLQTQINQKYYGFDETTNHTVIRSRKQLNLNKNSYAGFILNSKITPDGNKYFGYGIDAILNLKDDTYLKVVLAQTIDNETVKEYNILDPTRFLAQYEKRTFEGLSYNFNIERSGNTYDPQMGFEFRSDFSKFGHIVSYGIMPENDSKVLRSSFSVKGDYYFRNADQSLETINFTPSFNRVTKRSTELSFELPYVFDDLKDPFELSDKIKIQSGKYNNIGLAANYSTSSEKPLESNFYAFTGNFYGGWQNSFSIAPSLSIGNTWNISLNYYYYRIDFKELNEVYQNHLLRFKLWYMYSTKLSAYANVQYNSLNESFFINAKIRYNPKEGNDLYIVLNDDLNTSRFQNHPSLPFSNQRTILIKYTHTFRLR
jgi:hypothetical protein